MYFDIALLCVIKVVWGFGFVWFPLPKPLIRFSFLPFASEICCFSRSFGGLFKLLILDKILFCCSTLCFDVQLVLVLLGLNKTFSSSLDVSLWFLSEFWTIWAYLLLQ